MAKTVIASRATTLAEARAALEAARSSGVTAELESPPDAAAVYGVLWFAELNRALLAEFPGQPFTLTLDCGDRADLAHAALVEGIKRIRFNGHPEAANTLRDIAAQLNADLATAPWVQERIYVIVEPEIPADDRDWIQSVRSEHDPQFALIGPHFTLVFGGPSALGSALITRTQEVSSRFAPFAFDLQSALAVPETSSDHYVFLIPDLGSPELVQMHEALRLTPAESSTFVPHLTVGRAANPADADALVARLNAAKRVVRGRVAGLKVIAVADGRARDLATFKLAG